jgi:hypothetical protein
MKKVDPAKVRFVEGDSFHQDAVAVSDWLRTCRAPPFPSLARVLQHALPSLSEDEANEIFRSMEDGPCAGGFSDFERDWLLLLRAVGRRDAAGMVAAARAALSREADLSPPTLHYAVAAALLGSIAQGDVAGAREIWSRSGKSIPVEDDLFLRTLVARIGAYR